MIVSCLSLNPDNLRQCRGNPLVSTSCQGGCPECPSHDARRYAKRQGRLLLGTQKIWDSSIANIGISWVCEQARELLPAYLDNVYTPFWRRELDIEDIEIVAGIISASGVDADGFAAFVQGDGRTHHDRLQATLHPAGVFGVPSYVVDGEFYFGREHLPVVRWMLEGRRGRAPDAAYPL